MPHNRTPNYDRMIPIDNTMRPFMNQVSLPGYSNLPYLPAATAPIGLNSDGLPIGIQIIGPEYGDRMCIHFAGLLERHYRKFSPPPGYE